MLLYLPTLIANLFPVELRYSGVGCSFNIVDGIFWGIIPVFSVLIENVTKLPASFVILLPISALFSYYHLNFLRSTCESNHLNNSFFTLIYFCNT